jgi:hypothetical protein
VIYSVLEGPTFGRKKKRRENGAGATRARGNTLTKLSLLILMLA